MANSQRNRNRGGLLQLDKGLLQKPRANIILNGERVNAFTQRLGESKASVLITLNQHTLLTAVASAGHKEEIKGTKIKKEEVLNK